MLRSVDSRLPTLSNQAGKLTTEDTEDPETTASIYKLCRNGNKEDVRLRAFGELCCLLCVLRDLCGE